MRPITSVALSLSLVASNAAAENVPKSFVEKMIAKSMQAQCASSTYLACRGISAATCLEEGELYLKTCVAPLPEQVNMENPELEVCGNKLAKKLGADLTQVESCATAVDINKFDEEQGFEQMRPQESQQMGDTVELLIEREFERRKHEITIPLFPGYKPQAIHADGTPTPPDGTLSLPMAVITVPATKADVLNFYQSKLPNFKPDPNDPDRLVEQVLPGGETLGKYANVPHVEVIQLGDLDPEVYIIYRR